ncbi:YmdB family metallophosphoesterase [Candidatus Uhrbacteria bacterium]|nr:YmdB family metallophosphoesterase [Candidatus Uhrbacteria bacterium]
MKVIFIGDIVGKIGRKAVAKVLPAWKKKYKPDFVIANGENLAHGVGMTEKTVREVLGAGVDMLTGGNHSFKGEGWKLLERGELPLLRPANCPPDVPGEGSRVLQKDGKDGQRLLVINLIGRVFFHQNYDDPFRKFEAILANHAQADYDGVFVDFHTEATSEINALGHFADGRAAAVVGTHTHIGTVDARVLPKGTAFVSDVGAVAAVESILGEEKEGIIRSFLYQIPFEHNPVENGLCHIGAVLIEVDEKTKLAKSIKRIDEQIVIE